MVLRKTAALITNFIIISWLTLLATSISASPKSFPKLVLQPSPNISLRFNLWTQVWARAIANNPGTITSAIPDPNGGFTQAGEENEVSFDVLIRRARFRVIGELGDKILTVFHFGMNNQTYRNNEFGNHVESGPSFFVHDALIQYKLLDVDNTQLTADFGGGLIFWNGISRYTSVSSTRHLSLDHPSANFPLINANDQFARQLGFYLKGVILRGFIDYRLALVRPFSDYNQGVPAEVDGNGNIIPDTGSPGQNHWGFSSYLKLQFADHDRQITGSQPSTYLGSKTIFNIGAGVHYHPNGARNEAMEPVNILLRGYDVFIDLPFGHKAKHGALTVYGVLYQYDFGNQDFVRHVGIANISEGINPNNTEGILNGPGNAYPAIGNGTAVYGVVGYLLPSSIFGLQIQPYAASLIGFWTALSQPAPMVEGGANLYIYGNNAKITTHYRARPLMKTSGTKTGVFDRFASEVIIQMAIAL